MYPPSMPVTRAMATSANEWGPFLVNRSILLDFESCESGGLLTGRYPLPDEDQRVMCAQNDPALPHLLHTSFQIWKVQRVDKVNMQDVQPRTTGRVNQKHHLFRFRSSGEPLS